MLKKFLSILLICALCSCGFQVIYRDKEEGTDTTFVEELAAIRIKKDRIRLNQELKNSLYDLLNPDYIKSEPKYFLILQVNKTTVSTYTTSTGSSGRYRLTLDVSYQLKSLETGEEISHGNTSVNDSYYVTTNRYGTYTADSAVQSNLTKIAAQNIRNSLVNDLILMKKRSHE